MRSSAVLVLAITFALVPAPAQVSPKGSGVPPREVVEQLWGMATQGELLTKDGWGRASRLYANPIPWPGNKVIRVVSNHWWPEQRLINGKTAEIMVQYGGEAGRIDSALRYTPSGDRSVGMIFALDFIPTYSPTYGQDGKVIKETPMGDEWRFEVPSQSIPWTTVNTAIRYVLEMRDKTSDPAVKRNADKTLGELMKLN
jgi:hypothetical protein